MTSTRRSARLGDSRHSRLGCPLALTNKKILILSRRGDNGVFLNTLGDIKNAVDGVFVLSEGIRMRIEKSLVLVAVLLFSTSALSEDADIAVLDALQFNLGMVGFAGRISEAEKAMVNIQKRTDAGGVFFSIIDNKNSGDVAKLYALCGLKRVNSPRFDQAFDTLKSAEGQVSVTRGDVMKKESVTDLANQVKEGLC